jgi:hypothetical protein
MVCLEVKALTISAWSLTASAPGSSLFPGATEQSARAAARALALPPPHPAAGTSAPSNKWDQLQIARLKCSLLKTQLMTKMQPPNPSRSSALLPSSLSASVPSSLARVRMNAQRRLSTAAAVALETCLCLMETRWLLLLLVVVVKTMANAARMAMRLHPGAGGRGRDQHRLKQHLWLWVKFLFCYSA